jgi:uncharacterized repeat protein (TIGR01451 family)
MKHPRSHLAHALALALGLGSVATAALSQSLSWSVQPRGVAIAADALENVFTVDWDYNPAGDITLTKTAPNGVTLFTVRFDNVDPSRHEVATWVETDSGGGAFVSGTIRSGYSNPVNANALLMRCAANGALLWRRVLGTDFDGGSTVKVLRDAADNVYVLGLGPTPAGLRSRIHKVAPDGTVLWMWHDPAGIGAPVNLKWGANGNLVVAARAITGLLGGAAQVNRDGQTVNVLTGIPAVAGLDATADVDGATITVSLDPQTQQGRLVKHGASTSRPKWVSTDPVNMTRVEAAPDGGIVVAGTPSAGSFGVAFLKYGTDGVLQWAQRDADGPANAFLAHGQMRLDAAGNGYLAASNMSLMSVTRVNADGSAGWSVLAPFGYGVALAFGAQSGAVYVVGGQTARIEQPGAPPPSIEAPDLGVTVVDAPDPARVNRDITLTTTVRNAGTVGAAGVTLVQTASSSLNVVAVSTTQGSCSTAQSMQCALGTIAPGAAVTVTRIVRTRTPGTLVTTATAATTTPEPGTVNNTAVATTTVLPR